MVTVHHGSLTCLTSSGSLLSLSQGCQSQGSLWPGGSRGPTGIRLREVKASGNQDPSTQSRDLREPTKEDTLLSIVPSSSHKVPEKDPSL